MHLFSQVAHGAVREGHRRCGQVRGQAQSAGAHPGRGHRGDGRQRGAAEDGALRVPRRPGEPAGRRLGAHLADGQHRRRGALPRAPPRHGQRRRRRPVVHHVQLAAVRGDGAGRPVRPGAVQQGLQTAGGRRHRQTSRPPHPRHAPEGNHRH